MKHILFGGDGFVGRHLAQKLLSDGEEVVIADIVNATKARGGSSASAQVAPAE